MKDLFKGHNPWLLTFVGVILAVLAAVVRSKAVDEGLSTFNANFIFITILAGGFAIYGIFHEGLVVISDLICRWGWKKRGITLKPKEIHVEELPNNGATTSKLLTSAEAIATQPNVNEHRIAANLTKEEIEEMIGNAIRDNEGKTSDPISITGNKEDVLSFHIDMATLSKNIENNIQRESESVYIEAMLYTVDILGPYMSEPEMTVLLARLGMFQKAATKQWPVLAEGETTVKRLHPYQPISKIDLMHYGWNIGKLFDKNGAQINYFLKTTFANHFDNIDDRVLPKKLKQYPLQGTIKINEEFNPNYRKRLEAIKEKERREEAKAEREAEKQRKFEEQESRRTVAKARYGQQQAEKVASQNVERQQAKKEETETVDFSLRKQEVDSSKKRNRDKEESKSERSYSPPDPNVEAAYAFAAQTRDMDFRTFNNIHELYDEDF